ncbi:DUF6188 family protein [Streptomyces sp. NWU339]|uniref:DUF6188 family protein n=1 Tax=Streptomyces sp. NWU339 TaxID=2185284 RepID=UPI00215B1736|nr:DUF6188 family protein [Streptomyces sp. NWU339]
MKVPRGLTGTRVDRTVFDHQVRLVLSSKGDSGHGVEAELILENRFLFRDSSGQWHELEPGTGIALAPVLGLFGQSVTAVDVQGSGTLIIDFQDGAGLRIDPDPQFESDGVPPSGVAAITAKVQRAGLIRVAARRANLARRQCVTARGTAMPALTRPSSRPGQQARRWWSRRPSPSNGQSGNGGVGTSRLGARPAASP